MLIANWILLYVCLCLLFYWVAFGAVQDGE
jgi:hypothetical protein